MKYFLKELPGDYDCEFFSDLYLNITGIKCLSFFGQKLEVSWPLEPLKEICLFIIVRHLERFLCWVGYSWKHRSVFEMLYINVMFYASDFSDIAKEIV